MGRAAAVGVLWLISVGCLWPACGTVGTMSGYVSEGDGAKTCADFSKNLQKTSSNWAATGWTAGILAGLLSATGGIVGTGPDNARWYRKGAGVLIATLGGSLAATSAYSVSRSNAASSAAASAASALSLESDRQMYQQCATARASWLDSRAESLDQSPPPQAPKTRPAHTTPEAEKDK
jgi:hypothetical protein